MAEPTADEPDVVESYSGEPTRSKLIEIARYFLVIGIVGFGGPLVHIAMMEDDLVGEDSREWTDESIFMEGLAICNMLPGPASTQLGIFMGWIRAGNPGAIVAGFFFMLPTFIIVVFFSWLYFAYQQVPSVEAAFYGINPVVIGLIVGATWSMAQSALAEGHGHLEFSVRGDEWSIDFPARCSARGGCRRYGDAGVESRTPVHRRGDHHGRHLPIDVDPREPPKSHALVGR